MVLCWCCVGAALKAECVCVCMCVCLRVVNEGVNEGCFGGSGALWCRPMRAVGSDLWLIKASRHQKLPRSPSKLDCFTI